MAHISVLGLLDHLAGKSDLTSQEAEHLKNCPDCERQAIQLQRATEDSANAAREREFVAEEGRFPLVDEPPVETHADQRELDEKSG